MAALIANQAKSKKGAKSKKQAAKKRAKKPAVKKVVVRRQVLVEPAPVYQQYNPFGYYRAFNPPVVHQQYHYYQQPPAAQVRRVSMAPPAARSMDAVDLAERIRAESAALRAYKTDADIARARIEDGIIYRNRAMGIPDV